MSFLSMYLPRINIMNNISPLRNILWRYESNKPKITEKSMSDMLHKRFPKAIDIKVEDTSGGCGQMFSVYIETEEFKNLSVLKQHKLVYQTLGDQIKMMHGLHLQTNAPVIKS